MGGAGWVINTLSEISGVGSSGLCLKKQTVDLLGGDSDLSPNREPPNSYSRVSQYLSFSLTRCPSFLLLAPLFGSYIFIYIRIYTHAQLLLQLFCPFLSHLLFPCICPSSISHFHTGAHKTLTFVQQSLSPRLRLKLH